MYKKFSELQFVIGLFFSLTAVILAVNLLVTKTGQLLNGYTAASFFLFGMGMMFLKSNREPEDE